jgi:hypothetical protein
MLYILEVNVEIPNGIKKDGQYLTWLKDEIGHDEWFVMAKEILDIRKNKIKFFSRSFKDNICTNEYVAQSIENIDIVKSAIEKHMSSDKFIITYVEKEFDGSIRDYVFLQ